jgi:hypothetical protein
MTCLWKKFESCSCAFRLHAAAEEVLDHLAVFRSGTVILRQPGLSVSHMAAFGSGRIRDGIWQDTRSQLQSIIGARRIFHLLTDTCDARPLLVSGEPGKQIDLSIRLDGCTWQSGPLRRMIHLFHGRPVTCEESRCLGAGAWLDDWEPDHSHGGDPILARAARRELESCRWIEVIVRSSAHRKVVRFQPDFIDLDGSVLRVADRHCRHVIFADAESPSFRLIRGPDRCIHIHRALPAA